MEMSQRIHFWYQMLLKMIFFEEVTIKSLLWGKKFLDILQKNNFELNCKNCLKIIRQMSRRGFLILFEYGLTFENFDQKVPKKWFLAKIAFFFFFFF